jgi:hypothetical protein
MQHPSWFEHVDLMQLIIIGLILVVAWYEKADRTRLRAEIKDLWKRTNHHKHIIVCNTTACKPECGEVVIVAQDEG